MEREKKKDGEKGAEKEKNRDGRMKVVYIFRSLPNPISPKIHPCSVSIIHTTLPPCFIPQLLFPPHLPPSPNSYLPTPSPPPSPDPSPSSISPDWVAGGLFSFLFLFYYLMGISYRCARKKKEKKPFFPPIRKKRSISGYPQKTHSPFLALRFGFC